MKREYRIGFKIVCLIMALESVFWLIWLIFRPLPVLPLSGHITIWKADMILLPTGFVIAILLLYLTRELHDIKWLSIIAGLISAIGILCFGWGLGLALVTCIIATVAMLITFIILITVWHLGKVFFTSRPMKRLYDWILR